MERVDGTLGFVFPGQGSQSVGMLGELAAAHPEVESTFTVANEVLGFDLWGLIKGGPEAELNRTENTQPALLACSVAAWRIWTRITSIRPACMSGHSLGEYSALVCTGALAFEDALRLVRERGRLMQQAVPPRIGAMAAVLGLEDELIVRLCASVSTPEAVVSAANFNAPGQVVVAGHTPAVQRLVEVAKAEGAKRSVLLPVSVPSHCVLMKDAAAQLRRLLTSIPFHAPAIPVLHNVDVLKHDVDAEIRAVLEQQMYGSVRWSDTVKTMRAAGITRFVECGPGKVLAGLNKRIAPDSTIRSINDTESLNLALEFVQ